MSDQHKHLEFVGITATDKVKSDYENLKVIQLRLVGLVSQRMTGKDWASDDELHDLVTTLKISVGFGFTCDGITSEEFDSLGFVPYLVKGKYVRLIPPIYYPFLDKSMAVMTLDGMEILLRDLSPVEIKFYDMLPVGVYING